MHTSAWVENSELEVPNWNGTCFQGTNANSRSSVASILSQEELSQNVHLIWRCSAGSMCEMRWMHCQR